MNYETKATNKIKKITNKKNVFYTDKCRNAVNMLLQIIKEQQKTQKTKQTHKKQNEQKKQYEKVLLQDQGGWHTYEKAAKKKGYQVEFLKTKN